MLRDVSFSVEEDVSLKSEDEQACAHSKSRLPRDFIRASVHDGYSGSMKITHTWIILVIVKQHLVQIDRLDGPTEYAS